MTYLSSEDNTKWMSNPSAPSRVYPLVKPKHVIVIPYVVHNDITVFNHQAWNKR